MTPQDRFDHINAVMVAMNALQSADMKVIDGELDDDTAIMARHILQMTAVILLGKLLSDTGISINSPNAPAHALYTEAKDEAIAMSEVLGEGIRDGSITPRDFEDVANKLVRDITGDES